MVFKWSRELKHELIQADSHVARGQAFEWLHIDAVLLVNIRAFEPNSEMRFTVLLCAVSPVLPASQWRKFICI